MASPLTLQNATGSVMLLTDIRLAGVSVYDALKTTLVAQGRLEDPEDVLMLCPGESFVAVGLEADELHWIEL